MNDLARLEHNAAGPVHIAHVIGEIDVSNADDIFAEIVRAVPNSTGAVVLDLSGTTYLDSSGVRLLFELGRRLTARQQPARVVVPPESLLMRVLRIARVDDALPMREDTTTAVRELEGIVASETRPK